MDVNLDWGLSDGIVLTLTSPDGDQMDAVLDPDEARNLAANLTMAARDEEKRLARTRMEASPPA